MRQTPTTSRIIATALPEILEPYQYEWGYLWEAKIDPETGEDNRIPPFKKVTDNVYTVPEGKRLLLKGAMASADNDAYHKVWIVISTPGLLGDRYVLRSDSETFFPSQEIKSGHTLVLYFHNQSSQKIRANVSFIGIIQEEA